MQERTPREVDRDRYHQRVRGDNVRISPHECRCYLVLSGADGWVSNSELADRAEVSLRTVTLHTRRFVNLRLVEERPTFPEHRFRWLPDAGQRNPDYLERLAEAASILGPETQ